jgi:hypothetical protein
MTETLTYVGRPAASVSATRRLLSCGVLAGPLFAATTALQVLSRDGFDLRRHPISLLSLGEHGWVQIANFIVAGLLEVACAVGLWQVLRAGRARTWGSLLVGAFGVGLILAGVFVADPGSGFPAGMPERHSWHGVVHGVGAGLALDGMTVGCLVFARRFARRRERGWQWYSTVTAVLVAVLVWWPSHEAISIRLALAAALAFAFLAVLAGRLRANLASTA